MKSQLTMEKKRVTMVLVEEKLNALSRGLNTLRRKYITIGFLNIRYQPLEVLRGKFLNSEIKRCREEITSNYKIKETELDSIAKKLHDKQRAYNDQKLREADYQQKLKGKDRQLAELQAYLDNIRQKAPNQQGSAQEEDYKLRTLEQKVRN